MRLSRQHDRAGSILARGIRVFIPLWTLALPLSGLAETPEAEGPRAEAVRLGGEGATAYREGQYADALRHFDAAYRTYPAPALLLNLSRTELKLEQCEESLRYARLYRTSGSDQDVSYSESPVSWLAYVEAQCPEVEIRTAPEHSTIQIAGCTEADEATTPWKGRVSARPHAIVLRHLGFKDNQDTLNVKSGAAQAFSFSLNVEGGAPARRASGPDAAPPVETVPAQPPVLRPPAEVIKPRPAWTVAGPRTAHARTAFDVAMTLTAAAGVVGIVGGATALAAAGSPSNSADSSHFAAAQPVIQARATTANVGFGVAGAGLITSIVFWLKGESIFPEPSGPAHDP
jgi:hypothetical protein